VTSYKKEIGCTEIVGFSNLFEGKQENTLYVLKKRLFVDLEYASAATAEKDILLNLH
jgi:hypothetical protein